ncbi:MAG: type II toxin-antitoxin system PemK/MazF family toxin [Oscillospiraceae bacterium]|nr:type II toxin-antitoxin system PemK/MazF family toxin [Oscillospiraceae bacterium]
MTDIENKIYSKCQRLSNWNSQKIYYHFNRTDRRSWSVKRGEVYYVDFGENIGSEQSKARPCVVVQSDAFGFSAATFICAIISDSGRIIPDIHVPITGTYYYKENGVQVQLGGAIDLGHIRTIAKERILFKICTLTDEIPSIDKKLLNTFGLSKMMEKKDNRISFLEKRVAALQEKFPENIS